VLLCARRLNNHFRTARNSTRKIQIIVESHSEHLLRRLQRRIAEEKDGLSSQDIKLYFCNSKQDGSSSLTTLEIDDFGNIANWPENFFGDEIGDLFAMTEAAMKRQIVSE
jgi:predicted ATPase